MFHAIVTGHSRGLGAAIAENLLQRGLPVLGLARRENLELAVRFAQGLRQVRVDLADSTALLAWLDGPELRDFLAGADKVLLINNAGALQPVGPLGTQDGGAIARSVALNVTAPLLLSNAVVAASPAAIERRVMHVSSGVGRRPCAGWSVYCATKAAVDHHARTAATDLVPGLIIASLAPGVIDTEMQAEIRASDAAKFPSLPQFQALKRDGLLSTPADCAGRLVNYVLSKRCRNGDVADLRDQDLRDL